MRSLSPVVLASLQRGIEKESLRVRLDGGFVGEDLLAFLEAEGVEYVVALAGNTRLDKRVRRLMGRARKYSSIPRPVSRVAGLARSSCTGLRPS